MDDFDKLSFTSFDSAKITSYKYKNMDAVQEPAACLHEGRCLSRSELNYYKTFFEICWHQLQHYMTLDEKTDLISSMVKGLR